MPFGTYTDKAMNWLRARSTPIPERKPPFVNLPKSLKIGGAIAGVSLATLLGDKTYRKMKRFANEVPDELLQIDK